MVRAARGHWDRDGRDGGGGHGGREQWDDEGGGLRFWLAFVGVSDERKGTTGEALAAGMRAEGC